MYETISTTSSFDTIVVFDICGFLDDVGQHPDTDVFLSNSSHSFLMQPSRAGIHSNDPPWRVSMTEMSCRHINGNIYWVFDKTVWNHILVTHTIIRRSIAPGNPVHPTRLRRTSLVHPPTESKGAGGDYKKRWSMWILFDINSESLPRKVFLRLFEKGVSSESAIRSTGLCLAWFLTGLDNTRYWKLISWQGPTKGKYCCMVL